MGQRGSRPSVSASGTTLNVQEKKRLTVFLENRRSNLRFNNEEIRRLWEDVLVPDLLNLYLDYLMRTCYPNKEHISVDEFATVYISLVRGLSGEKVRAIIGILGSKTNSKGEKTISCQSFYKYLSDLLNSYLLELKSRNDVCYKSWTNTREPQPACSMEVMKGVCSDLTVIDDYINARHLEQFLDYSGLINVLHSYVLGCMYNLEPEVKSNILPCAQMPTTKTRTLLDVAHVVYLNSFLPSEYKNVWRFLYSISTHGESFSKFANCISNEGPVIIIVRSDEDHVFGGYISTNVLLGPKWTGTFDSFLFKLQPFVVVYPATGFNDHYAYLNMNQTTIPNGLGMGGQFNYWGLFIDSQFGIGECSESCTTYRNYRMINHKKKFRIRNLEAWAVGRRPPSSAEKGERSTGPQQSVLNRDAATTQILEMAGRVMHSKAIREEDRSTDFEA